MYTYFGVHCTLNRFSIKPIGRQVVEVSVVFAPHSSGCTQHPHSDIVNPAPGFTHFQSVQKMLPHGSPASAPASSAMPPVPPVATEPPLPPVAPLAPLPPVPPVALPAAPPVSPVPALPPLDAEPAVPAEPPSPASPACPAAASVVSVGAAPWSDVAWAQALNRQSAVSPARAAFRAARGREACTMAPILRRSSAVANEGRGS